MMPLQMVTSYWGGEKIQRLCQPRTHGAGISDPEQAASDLSLEGQRGVGQINRDQKWGGRSFQRPGTMFLKVQKLESIFSVGTSNLLSSLN